MFSQGAGHTGLKHYRGTTAPLPEADVARSYAPFGSSTMLPAGAYTDPQVFAWEQANIFSGWQCVGMSTALGVVGSQTAVQTGTGEVLLTRAEDGVLRAFANSCRHRAHELVPCGETVTKRSIVCPYHAWSYKLDGTLRNAPGGLREDTGFDKSQFGLIALPLVEWHGYVFVDPSGQAGNFEDHIAGLEPVVAPYRPEELVTVTTHSYELATNWKVIVENYQECYHCAFIHPELTRISPPESGENIEVDGDWMGGYMDLIPEAVTMSLDGASHGIAIEGLSEHELRTVMYLVGFPNVLISLHPDYVMTHLLRPLGPDRTYVECSWAFPKAAVETPGFDGAYAVDFWDLTNRQDWTACESVQRGLNAPGVTPGPLAPEEDGVYHFVSRVARAYAGLDATASAQPSMVAQPADNPLGVEAAPAEAVH